MRNWVDLIARADTEFVASLNDDDFWEPEFLARTVPAMVADPSIAMSFSDVWYVDEVGRRLPRLSAFWSARSHRDQLPTGRLDLSSEELFRMITVWNSPQPAYAAVMRRDAVEKIEFPPETDPCHDLWCSYRLWTSGYGFHYTNARLTNYRVHTGNLTNAGIGEAEDYIFAVMERENIGREALADMRHRLARTQFSRATGLASVDIAAAQRQFSAAARGLSGWRGRVASTGAHSPLACDIVGRLKRFKDAAGKTSATRIFREQS